MSRVSWRLFFSSRSISSATSDDGSTPTRRSSSILACSSAIGCSKSRYVCFMGADDTATPPFRFPALVRRALAPRNAVFGNVGQPRREHQQPDQDDEARRQIAPVHVVVEMKPPRDAQRNQQRTADDRP